MRRLIVSVVILPCLIAGCANTYEIDLSRTPDFEWSRRVRVTTETPWLPWFAPRIVSVELPAMDGRIATITQQGTEVKAVVDLPVRSVEITTRPST